MSIFQIPLVIINQLIIFVWTSLDNCSLELHDLGYDYLCDI